MKKIIIFLCIILITLFGYISYADSSYSTQVEYNIEGSESYKITVPAKMAPGDSGKIIVEGEWGSNRKITVGVDDTVTLSYKKNNVTLDISFDDMVIPGNDWVGQMVESDISISNMPDNILLGTWTGMFNYNVDILDMVAWYSYNGYELPVLPDYGNDTDYVALSYLTTDGFGIEGEYAFDCMEYSKPFERSSDGKLSVSTGEDGLVSYHSIFLSSDELISPMVEAGYNVTESKKWNLVTNQVWDKNHTVYPILVEDYGADIIWTNYDILNEDGSIYFPKSEDPVFLEYR